MEGQLLSVKVEISYFKLLQDLYKAARMIIREKGRSLSWLRYAEKKPSGYRFIDSRENKWPVLQKIARRVQQNNPSIRFGQIVDELSYRVNTSVSDEMPDKDKLKKISTKDRKYLETLLIEIKPSNIIPRYPWLMAVKGSYPKKEFKDVLSKKHYLVRKISKDGFIYFYFEKTRNNILLAR